MTKKIYDGPPKKPPPMRKGNLCSRPGCDNEKPAPGKYAPTTEDPFCSTLCCRLWFGTAEQKGDPAG